MITNFELETFLMMITCYSIVMGVYISYRFIKHWLNNRKNANNVTEMRTNNTKVNVHNTKPIIKYKK